MHAHVLSSGFKTVLLKPLNAFKMGGLSPVHSNDDPSRDVYLEFSFFDGVMVECGDINISDWRSLESKENNCKKKGNAASLTEQNHLQTGEPQDNIPANAGFDSVKGDRAEVRGPFAMCCSPSTSQDPEGETCSCAPSHRSVAGGNPSEVLSERRLHWRDRNTCESFIGNSSISSGSVMSPSFHCSSLGTKDLSLRKRVQFCSDENTLSGGQQAGSENSTWHKISGPILKNCHGSSRAHNSRHISQQGKHLQCDSWQTPCVENSRAEFAAGNPWSQTDCIDWVSSENSNRKECVLAGETGHGEVHVADTRSSNWMIVNSEGVDETREKALLSSATSSQRGKLSSLGDRVNTSYRQSWKSTEKEQDTPGLTEWASVVVADSPRCSSASMTDLAESVMPKRSLRSIIQSESSPTLASHLELTGTALAQSKFQNDCPKDADMDSRVPLGHFDPVQPVTKTSLNPLSAVNISTTKKEFTMPKLEPKKLSITDPAPYGTMHGLLHSTLRHGLPNYTFLLDNYEEVVTAKIWTEDMVLGEEQGAWRYTFYSLKGEGKKKGKTGWKHWRRKEKLASILVGKMKVSSILCSDSQDGDGNMSVVSEFVLFSARSQEPSIIAQADMSPTTGLSSLKMVSPGHSEGNYTGSNSSGTSFQCPASFSNGQSGASSPGAISAWYVQQSLLPSSLAAPEIVEGRKSSRKWSLQSGISSMQINKTRRNFESSSLTSSNIDIKDSSMDLTWSPNQIHSELAAMIINVPLEMQDKQASAELPSRTSDEPNQDFGFTDLQRPHNHIQHKNHDQRRQADITVILPSGNHSKPLSDSKGPSPLIRRWKDGGKCDCRGWDLGCGLVVLSNQRPKLSITTLGNANEAANYRENQSQGKPLTLFKQDTDQEDPSLSLAPQKNGLIALDFRAPLSPLQAFAIAVAILHGREPGISDVNTHQVVPTAGTKKEDGQARIFVNQSSSCTDKNINGPFVSSVEGEGTSDSVRLSTFLNQDRSQLHNSLCNTRNKIQGSDALNCASELALSFERV